MKDEPAFPSYVDIVEENDEKVTYENAGLTKREYFAAMAMQGFCSHHGGSWYKERNIPDWAADYSVMMADALIKELEK